MVAKYGTAKNMGAISHGAEKEFAKNRKQVNVPYLA
jgi:hypothetical protein